MDLNPKMTDTESKLFNKIYRMQRKHIFTKNFGDGEISKVTRKDDLSGLYVYFDSNIDGQIKIDGLEFLEDVLEVKD
ncbi:MULTISPECIES: hypothetical protein [Bacillus amyloliquefaciens group]|uniref:hypothetical protein n=1 Tax=Bacillus amyloliquefaciens group TaxID=1938374 RepID=UPI00073BFADB|nr:MULTISPECIES: hypothetical protein [Bacillus amyloliquefaciens group]KTF59777.1 hypothetical protein AR691_13670 [Bacillus amyloliquefaciens]